MRRPFLVLALIATALGCAANLPHEPAGQPPPATNRPPAPPAGGAPQAAADAPAAAPAIPRKLIHNATLELLTDDFDKARREILGLIETHQALISQSEITGTQDTPRVGH
jgi:hypothetical protein